MNPEEQRRAIAEVCGWKPLGRCGHRDELCWENPKWPGSRITFAGLPAYTSDLNAMHEAEKVLHSSHRNFYVYNILLAAHCKPEDILRDYDIITIVLLSSTAAQRAEAFLRTLNLWKE